VQTESDHCIGTLADSFPDYIVVQVFSFASLSAKLVLVNCLDVVCRNYGPVLVALRFILLLASLNFLLLLLVLHNNLRLILYLSFKFCNIVTNLLSGVERVFSVIDSDSTLVRLSIIEKSFNDCIWMHLLTLILNHLRD
jgi:hypothetical protein